jgi:hypothetical protein
MMSETTVDCEGGGAFLAVIYLVTKFCSYKSDFDLDIVQRFFYGKKMVQIFWILKERKKSFQICITGSSR